MAEHTPPDHAATVMIVDDEEMVARSLRSFLELETTYDILTFTSPDEALERADGADLNVVIADFMMPSMDGITFLQHLRDLQPQATRMLLTGYADKENAIRAINEAGLYYYLEKPWNNEHLKLVIRNGVERSTLFTELDTRVRALEGAHRELTDIRKRLVQTFL
ncbi:MAG TPA: response regulator [Longimicrobiales bacterium]|nr:response regulator [Longimicrobiales bacterium]